MKKVFGWLLVAILLVMVLPFPTLANDWDANHGDLKSYLDSDTYDIEGIIGQYQMIYYDSSGGYVESEQDWATLCTVPGVPEPAYLAHGTEIALDPDNDRIIAVVCFGGPFSGTGYLNYDIAYLDEGQMYHTFSYNVWVSPVKPSIFNWIVTDEDTDEVLLDGSYDLESTWEPGYIVLSQELTSISHTIEYTGTDWLTRAEFSTDLFYYWEGFNMYHVDVCDAVTDRSKKYDKGGGDGEPYFFIEYGESGDSYTTDIRLNGNGIRLDWNCPLDHESLIAPYPAMGRDFLDYDVNLYNVEWTDGDWFQVLWYDEGEDEWLYFYSGFTIGNTLECLEVGEYYTVIVDEPCHLLLPQFPQCD